MVVECCYIILDCNNYMLVNQLLHSLLCWKLYKCFNPHLWLQLAETSIVDYNKAQMVYAKQQYYHSQTVVGAGFHQVLLSCRWRCLQQAGTLPLESILLRVTELLPQIDYTSTVW
ncbi:uncharacterized protein [Dysidea avara]|uniref:uncharacterized protein isoform X1 n=1 Tax=Dysidea avara TaxID=196820 RepID=UPI003319E0F3